MIYKLFCTSNASGRDRKEAASPIKPYPEAHRCLCGRQVFWLNPHLGRPSHSRRSSGKEVPDGHGYYSSGYCPRFSLGSLLICRLRKCAQPFRTNSAANVGQYLGAGQVKFCLYSRFVFYISRQYDEIPPAGIVTMNMQMVASIVLRIDWRQVFYPVTF